jgi:hypothetical protein
MVRLQTSHRRTQHQDHGKVLQENPPRQVNHFSLKFSVFLISKNIRFKKTTLKKKFELTLGDTDFSQIKKKYDFVLLFAKLN